MSEANLSELGKKPEKAGKREGAFQLDAMSLKESLAQNPIFKDLDPDFLEKLAGEMQLRMVNDRDFVLRKGEEGRALFFILRGEIEVISEDGETVYNVMKENSFFGELALLFAIPRTASCRAKGKTIIMVLTKEKLEKVAMSNAEVSKAIAHIAEERYQLYKKQMEAEINCDFGDEVALGITKEELKNVDFRSIQL
jgi:CRP-like cAMP-binding protein